MSCLYRRGKERAWQVRKLGPPHRVGGGVKVCPEPRCLDPRVLGSCLYITLLLKLTNPKQCPAGLWLTAGAQPEAELLRVQPAVGGRAGRESGAR